MEEERRDKREREEKWKGRDVGGRGKKEGRETKGRSDQRDGKTIK